MKKLSILFVSVLTLGLAVTSCSSDDDDASIVGKWELSQVGTIVNGKEVYGPIENEGGCAISTFEYAADGTFTDTYSEFEDNKCTPYTEKGKYVKDGNKLTLTYEGNTESDDAQEIIELSGSTLKLKETYSESGITVSAIGLYKRK
ncbi:hypothetical protein B4N84_24520 [Flavobacterium sp. IR1]|nr:hypothetical protein B4N84_24520 [Flavobacterium sp. IR1]